MDTITITKKEYGKLLEAKRKLSSLDKTKKGLSKTIIDAFRRSAGGWKGHVDVDMLIENIYADRLVSMRPEPRL